MEYRALTDEELAWQIAREMEAEEIAREQRDAEFAHRLQGELDSYHEPPKTPSYEPDLRNAPPVSLATRSEWPEISGTRKVALL